MTTDLVWLAAVAALTALLWIPYILARISASGVMATLTYAADNDPLPGWAARAKKAHGNAVENLAPFAAAVLAVHAAGLSNATTSTWAAIYFWARLVHYFVYAAAVPFARTAAFTVGWIAIMVIAMQILL